MPHLCLARHSGTSVACSIGNDVFTTDRASRAAVPVARVIPDRSAREAMEAAEAEVEANPKDQRALERLLQTQTTFEAVGGLTQDKTVAQVCSLDMTFQYA